MNWILGVVFIIIIFYIINNFSRKKRLKKLKEQLIKNWGKQKTNEYFNFHVIQQYFENNSEKEIIL